MRLAVPAEEQITGLARGMLSAVAMKVVRPPIVEQIRVEVNAIPRRVVSIDYSDPPRRRRRRKRSLLKAILIRMGWKSDTLPLPTVSWIEMSRAEIERSDGGAMLRLPCGFPAAKPYAPPEAGELVIRLPIGELRDVARLLSGATLQAKIDDQLRLTTQPTYQFRV